LIIRLESPTEKAQGTGKEKSMEDVSVHDENKEPNSADNSVGWTGWWLGIQQGTIHYRVPPASMTAKVIVLKW
jgi:hypothetical protein